MSPPVVRSLRKGYLVTGEGEDLYFSDKAAAMREWMKRWKAWEGRSGGERLQTGR